jgi:hypothetical protein
MVTHLADNCPVKKQSLPTTTLIGSADPRLEFYHTDCPYVNDHNPGVRIVGIVDIEVGEVSKAKLAKEFSENYKTSWTW